MGGQVGWSEGVSGRWCPNYGTYRPLKGEFEVGERLTTRGHVH